jgi:hypothetical protein
MNRKKKKKKKASLQDLRKKKKLISANLTVSKFEEQLQVCIHYLKESAF